jgi:hypothetical protein
MGFPVYDERVSPNFPSVLPLWRAVGSDNQMRAQSILRRGLPFRSQEVTRQAQISDCPLPFRIRRCSIYRPVELPVHPP